MKSWLRLSEPRNKQIMRSDSGKVILVSIFVIMALAAVIGGSPSILAAGKSSNGSSTHHEYSQASLSGTYARVGTYQGNVAAALGVVVF
jgi:hypothetical protein